MLDFSRFNRVVVLAGAGISAESGVPTFRSHYCIRTTTGAFLHSDSRA